MKKFVIFRHGETDYNKAKRMQGCGINMDLNAMGRQQALELTGVLEKNKVQIVYSSPLLRALSTANIAAGRLFMPVKVHDMLHEADLGLAEGMFISEIAMKYQEIWKHWFTPNEFMDLRFPLGESKKEIGERIAWALRDIAECEEECDIIGIATHGAAIRNFLMPLGREDKPMRNGEVFIVDYDGKNFTLIR